MAISKLPQGWVGCELKNIAKEIISGSGFPKIYQGNKIGDYPFAKVGDISKLFRNKKKTIDSAENYINEDVKDKIKGKIFPANTIVFPKIGEALKGNYRLITRKKMLFDNNVMGIVFSNNINILFLYYFLVTQDFGKFSVATTIPSIQKGCIEGIKINLPPLNEQRRIVEKIEEEFGKIDVGVEKLRFALEQIKQYRQAVLKSAFDGKLYKTTEWEEKTFNSILEVNPKTDIPQISNGDLVSFLPMSAVQAETNQYTEEFVSYQKVKKGYTKFKNGDVLFAKITPCMENGKSCVVDNLKYEVGFGSTEFHILRSLGSIIPKFIFYYIVQESFRKKAQNAMTGAVGQRRVSADYLKNTIINIPSTIAEQQQIVKEIEKRLKVADRIETVIRQNLDKAEQLKQSILKKAFEGRLVPQDPNDEPASVLLEKIKAERKNK